MARGNCHGQRANPNKYSGTMNITPTRNSEFEIVSIPGEQKRRIIITLFSDEIRALQYPIIVESWYRKADGRGKRLWIQTFSTEERKAASALYKKFYRWHLQSGTPQQAGFAPSTIEFIQRLVAFFAEL